MNVRGARSGARARRGLALVVVLLVLLALLVLCTPFLVSARNADRAASELSDRAQSRIALDAAARHARAVLYDSHSGLDATPYFDDLAEIDFDAHIDPAFLDPADPRGVMWDADLADVAGKIDLNSASPQAIANLMGLATRFAGPIAADDKELPLASMVGFPPTGFLWANGELIHYDQAVESTLTRFQRGLLGPPDPSQWHGGPKPPTAHDAGAPVIDQRAFALALKRLESPDGELNPLDAIEELPDIERFALATVLELPGETFDADCLRPLYQYGSTHGGVRGGPVWQRAARLAQPVEGGKDGAIVLEDPRWINAGATVRIDDGAAVELAIVQSVSKSGEIFLDRVLSTSFEAFEAEVRVLARRPVNLNTAPVEVLRALFANLQLVGRNARITRDEARELADLVVLSRPFEGFEDFLRRVVLPAAALEKLPSDAPVVPPILQSNTAFIDPEDALALYTNGLNANDGSLLYSTMPYCFSTRDTYALELRATVNAPSGVERFSVVRDEVRLVVPQRELVALWARQEDFDEAVRLDCESPWWMSGPSSITRFEAPAAIPPSRVWAHMGTYEGRPFLPGMTEVPPTNDPNNPPAAEHVFASREEDAWIQLWPSRVAEHGRRRGRMMHFDHETRDPEGRYLPDETIVRPVDDPLIAWVDNAATASSSTALLKPLSFSMWVKPKALAPSMLLDVAGSDTTTDRLSISMEGPDLVLRVLDAAGDHPATAFEERAEVRYELAAGTSPGLPQDVWSHVAIDVRGSRPDHMTMLVNGLAHGVRTMGQTRLTAAADPLAGTLAVESTAGFPQQCAVRVGNEVYEVTVSGQTTFTCQRQETGPYAGFGGAAAREPYDLDSEIAPPAQGGTAPTSLPSNLNNLRTHPSGTTVQLYGYSRPLLSDLPAGRSRLANAIGPFRVAHCVEVQGTQSSGGDPIIVGLGFTAGLGLEGATSNGNVLVLQSADDPGPPGQPTIPPEEYMPAFQKDGGYAALVQLSWLFNSSNQSSSNTPLGGVEVIRYSGWDGNQLTIAARGDELGSNELVNLPAAHRRARAFVAKWEAWVANGDGTWANLFDRRFYVVPISLSVPGATTQRGYHLDATVGRSRFAQLTEIDQAELTEWVRYDEFEFDGQVGIPPQLVRDDPAALDVLQLVLTGTLSATQNSGTPPPGGGGGGNPGGGGMTEHATFEPPPASAASAARAAQASGGSPQWDPRVGVSENTGLYVTDAVASQFHFRGVLGTYSHAHVAQTLVLPVFTAVDRGFDGGRPGSMDAAFVFDYSSNSPGQAVRVARAHSIGPTTQRAVASWDQIGDAMIAGSTGTVAYDNYLRDQVYIALQEPSSAPIAAGAVNPSGNAPLVDSREQSRITCFPSGERPRAVTSVAIGGAVAGSQAGAIPSAVVDEIVFGDPQIGTKVSVGAILQGCSLILDAAISDSDLNLTVRGLQLRTPSEDYGTQYTFLADLDPSGGLLRIGEEIVAYDRTDPGSNSVSICPAGRGLLGTRAQPHEATEPIVYLEDWPASFLASALDAGGAEIQLGNTQAFPNEGTLLIGAEIVHYTRRRSGSVLEMPRASSEPGKQDEKGNGIFRGRFGTLPDAHATGTAVILMPFRYWDRFALEADGPELSYHLLHVDQPAALWSSCFFAKEDGQASQLGVLQRTDSSVPWDSDPEREPRLVLHWQGDDGGKPIAIAKQSDRIEWRVFVQYSPGAFDLATGMPYGWRESPRLKRFGAFYYGPDLVMRSVER